MKPMAGSEEPESSKARHDDLDDIQTLKNLLELRTLVKGEIDSLETQLE